MTLKQKTVGGGGGGMQETKEFCPFHGYFKTETFGICDIRQSTLQNQASYKNGIFRLLKQVKTSFKIPSFGNAALFPLQVAWNRYVQGIFLDEDVSSTKCVNDESEFIYQRGGGGPNLGGPPGGKGPGNKEINY